MAYIGFLVNYLFSDFDDWHFQPSIATDCISAKGGLKFEIEIINIVRFVKKCAFDDIIEELCVLAKAI